MASHHDVLVHVACFFADVWHKPYTERKQFESGEKRIENRKKTFAVQSGYMQKEWATRRY